MKNQGLTFFLLFIGVMMIQCKKDLSPAEEVASTLNGAWEVISYHKNGESKLGDPYPSIQLIFTKTGSVSGRAHIDFKGIFGDIIDPVEFFEVVSEGTRIVIGSVHYNLHFENDVLSLVGNTDNELIEIRAIKK